MRAFNVAITGDTGVDIFTRTSPSVTSENEKEFYPSVAYDLELPCGARLHQYALASLLPNSTITICPDRIPKEPTLPKTLQFLHNYRWNGKNVYRIKQMLPRKLPAMPATNELTVDGSPVNATCLLIYDSSRNWRRSKAAQGIIAAFLNQFDDDNQDDKKPKVIVNLSGPVPQLQIGPDGAPRASKDDGVWEVLLKHPKDVAIICSITALRHAGAAISRRLSWEQTIEDTIVDLQLFESLQGLSYFRHLIIRFGFAGSLYIEATEDEEQPHRAQFVFAPNVRDGVFRDPNEDGRIVGRKAVIAACLIREIERRSSERDLGTQSVINSIKSGMLIGMQMFDHGFPSPSEDRFQHLTAVGDESNTTRYLHDYFSCRPQNDEEIAAVDVVAHGYDELLGQGRIVRGRILGTVDVPSRVFGSSNQARRVPWQIVRHQVQNGKISRINLGIAICKYGHDEVLNRNLLGESPDKPGGKIPATEICELLSKPECLLSANEPHDEDPLGGNVRPALPYPTSFRQKQRPRPASVYIPVLQFGKFIAIERDEIESFRSIRNLMKTYVESPAQPPGSRRMTDRPMSIAVFGSPGSGKSFAIKQIAKSINESASDTTQPLEQIECNVAQFRSVDDLGHVITRIASTNNEGKMPLVFFDEFDCEFEGKPLGWLKYFLGPMQDGTFYGAKQTINFGRAIFIFAGGIYRTISDFDAFAEPVGSPRPEKTERLIKDQALFRDQKGPDFVSRLRGHINILTVNPDDGAPRDEYGLPIKPIIRRALILRSNFEKEGIVVTRQGCQVANIDTDILYALLTVDEYRHQVRSMEAILQMCTPLDGVIEKASLPSRAQLNMHVDADEFLIRVQRGRFRNYLAPQKSQIEPGMPQPATTASTLDNGARDAGAAGSETKQVVTLVEAKPEVPDGSTAAADQNVREKEHES